MAACAAIQPHVEAADAALDRVGGIARFQADDGYLCGPVAEALEAFHVLEEGLETKGCFLSKPKCSAWGPHLSVEDLDAAKRAASWECDARDLPLVCQGIVVSGTPVGKEGYVYEWLQEKVEKCRTKVEIICDCLQSRNRHALLTTLRLSTQCLLDHWLRTCYPSDVKWAAKEFDKIITNAYECATVAGITKDAAGMKRLRLPAKQFGLGFRSREWQSDSAFVAATDAAISRFVSRGDFAGFLPNAEVWLGGDWAEGGSRWKELYDSTDADSRAGRRCNSQLVRELRQSWALMQQAAGVATGQMPVGGDKEKPCFLHHADNELIGGKGKGGQHLLTAERERTVFRDTNTWFHTQLDHHDNWRHSIAFCPLGYILRGI